jgi:hypothetical protein
MFKHIMHAIVLVSLGSGLAACGSAPAAAPTPVPAPVITAKGNWTGTVKEGNTGFTTSAVFTDLDGTLAGSLTICPLGICVTSNSLTGTRSGTNVSITGNFDGGPVNLNGTISGNNMSGTITVDGTAGQLTLNRN